MFDGGPPYQCMVVYCAACVCVVCDLPRSRGRTSRTCREVRRLWALWRWSSPYITTSRLHSTLWMRSTLLLTSRTSPLSPTTSRCDVLSLCFGHSIPSHSLNTVSMHSWEADGGYVPGDAPPKKMQIPPGDLSPHLIHGCLVPPESTFTLASK